MNKPTYEQLEAQVKQLAAENAALKAQEPKAWFIDIGDSVTTDFNEAEKWRGRPLGLLDIETPATDAILASLRAEGVDMAMEAAKPEVANEFQRETFDQCVTAAVKYPQSDLAGKVEMVAWLELFAAQLRSKSEVQND